VSEAAGGRIVLHVGAPKTGSTYLQRRLRADTARLRAHGIYVPVLPPVARMAGNAKLLATALSRAPSPTFVRTFPEIGPEALDPEAIANALLREWRPGAETLVLSAENFRPHHAAALRDLLPRGAAYAVVLLVRRQDDWIESYHNQMVKVGELACDLRTFIGTVCEGDGDRFCFPDWDAHAAAWRDAFGDCRVLFYDEVRRDLFAAFARAAEIAVPPEYPDVAPAQLALDAHQLAYLLALNRPFEALDFARRRSALEAASRRLGAPAAVSLLAPDDRERLRERFEPANRRLLERLGRTPDDPVLRIGAPRQPVRTLDEIYASAEYADYRALAESILAGEA
jgi:hypothetical protein